MFDTFIEKIVDPIVDFYYDYQKLSISIMLIFGL
jgi:hypothetical protein